MVIKIVLKSYEFRLLGSGNPISDVGFRIWGLGMGLDFRFRMLDLGN